MGEGFTVDTGELRSHAGQLTGIQGDSAEAVAAGHQVTPGGWDNAYGVICQMFPQLLRPTAERGIDALQRVTDGLANHAAEIRRTADSYDQVEEQIAEDFQRVLSELEKPIRGGFADGH